MSSPAVSGTVICGLFVVATIVAVASRALPARRAMVWGLALLLPTVALLITAEIGTSMPLLVVATLFAGITGALGYRGSLQVVNDIAPAKQRGEVVSSYLISVYLGNSVPIIGVGLLSARTNLLMAHAVFATVIAALALAALLTERSGFASVNAKNNYSAASLSDGSMPSARL
jgi:sugar phosphate permease